MPKITMFILAQIQISYVNVWWNKELHRISEAYLFLAHGNPFITELLKDPRINVQYTYLSHETPFI